MLISVIAPVFNEAPHLPRFLEAITSQDFPGEYEVIVVDNGSTDGSLELLERHGGVTLLCEEKRGSYAARNRGIRVAQGRILAFIDPDCIPEPDWLAAIENAMDFAGREIVLGKRRYDTPSRALGRLSDYDSTVAKHVFSSDSPEIYFGYTNNMAVRRSLFERMGLFHEILRGGDTVFVRNTVDRLGPACVVYAPDMRVTHTEIRRVSDFYRKRVLYGTSGQRAKSLGSARPLGLKERMQVFKSTTRDYDYSLLGAAELFVLLVAGVACYEFGRWRGRRSPEPGPGAGGDASGSAAVS